MRRSRGAAGRSWVIASGMGPRRKSLKFRRGHDPFEGDRGFWWSHLPQVVDVSRYFFEGVTTSSKATGGFGRRIVVVMIERSDPRASAGALHFWSARTHSIISSKSRLYWDGGTGGGGGKQGLRQRSRDPKMGEHWAWVSGDGKWRVAESQWRVASGEWRNRSGEWRVASGEKDGIGIARHCG
jgi:hypothetical protein